jgi:hypothetical protein
VVADPPNEVHLVLHEHDTDTGTFHSLEVVAEELEDSRGEPDRGPATNARK